MPQETTATADARSDSPGLLAFARRALRPDMRGELARRLRRRLWSDVSAIGFRRDMSVPFEAPDARIPLVIRELEAADAPAMFGEADPTLDVLERWERTSRLRLWTSGLGRAFVAVAPDGRPCFVQWVFLERDNAGLHSYFGGAFPVLAPGEALVEGAYTPAAFRGKGVMPAAMARIALEGGKLGARHLHTFVEVDNMASLKGCVRAGYLAHQWREQHWRLGRRRHEFVPLPTDFATRFAAMYRRGDIERTAGH